MLARLVATVLLILMVPQAYSHGLEVLNRHRVLVIYGNADLSPWIHEFNSALATSVSSHSSIFLQIELLEVSQYTDEEKIRYADAISEKLQKFPPDLVVGVLPGASEFVHEYIDRFAPETDTLYVLPSGELRQTLVDQNHPAVIGSYWPEASEKTFDLIQTLLPDIEHLYYVVGVSDGNRSYYDRAVAAIGEKSAALQIHLLSGLTPEEMVTEFNLAPPNSAAIYITQDHDRFGARYTDPELLKIVKAAKVPLFSMQNTVVGSGVVGGNFTSAKLYGTDTGAFVKAILIGASLPKQKSQTLTVLDHEQMERFGLDAASVEGEVHVVNRDTSIWQQYWRELLIGASIMFLQLLLIAMLYAESRRRKVMEKDKVNQSRLFDSVINGISDAVVVTNEAGRIIATNNPGFELTFSMRPAQVRGRMIQELFNGEVALDMPEASILSCHRSESFFPGETVIKPILDIEGQTVGYFSVVRDVSDRLAEQEELRQAHKMEAVGNLAGGIAHDFNNILMAIIGNAEIAIDATNQEESVEYLQRILSASDRARDLVKQIMSFSRRDDADVMEAVELGGLLKESKALIETSFPSSIAVDITEAEDLWFIEANPTQLQQIVLNLCSNANHAMGGAGVINIELANKTFPTSQYLLNTTMPAGDYVMLEVTDTGAGIDEDHLVHIFEPFFTTKDRGKGTGMGLAMVYRITESHGAFIDIRTSSAGTAFTIYFPAQQVVPVPEKSLPNDVQSLDDINPRVLLVDDDEMVVSATESLLQQMGCQVLAFSNPFDALKEFEQRPMEVDLLITDQVMPGLDGVSLAEKVRSIRSIPVVLCTGNAEVVDLLLLDGIQLLRKPYSQGELCTLIASTVADDSSMPAAVSSSK